MNCRIIVDAHLVRPWFGVRPYPIAVRQDLMGGGYFVFVAGGMTEDT